MEQQDHSDADVNRFEIQWGPVLRGSLLPTGEEMLAFYAGALSDEEAARVRESIRTSPRALREYARMTDRTVAQVQDELQPSTALLKFSEALRASTTEVVRRIARLLSVPSTPIAVFKGDTPPAQSYEVLGDPTATLVIEQTPVILRRYRVTGQIIFEGTEQNASGEFHLSHNEVMRAQGPLSETGSFDLGTLPSGLYRLEILMGAQVSGQVIDVRELRVGDIGD